MPITMVPTTSGRPRVPLADIPEDVAQAVEDAWTFCEANPERLEAQFADQDAAEVFLHQARSYAYQRPAGRLVVAGNTTQKGAARFRVVGYTAPVDAAPGVNGGPDPEGKEGT